MTVKKEAQEQRRRHLERMTQDRGEASENASRRGIPQELRPKQIGELDGNN